MQPSPETPPEPLTWVSHPARERPGHLALATGIILALTLSILWADGSVLMALTGAAILLVATGSFFIPTRFTLGARGVVVAMPGYVRRRPWEQLRRWEEDGNGILLSPYGRPRPILEWRRGIFLRGGIASPSAGCCGLASGQPMAPTPGRVVSWVRREVALARVAEQQEPSWDGSQRPEGLSPEDEALVERLLGQVSRYGMGVPAIFLLEAFSPLAVVGSQAMHFLSPIIGTFGVTGDYDRLARLLERRDVLEALICRIEARLEGEEPTSDAG